MFLVGVVGTLISHDISNWFLHFLVLFLRLAEPLLAFLWGVGEFIFLRHIPSGFALFKCLFGLAEPLPFIFLVNFLIDLTLWGQCC